MLVLRPTHTHLINEGEEQKWQRVQQLQREAARRLIHLGVVPPNAELSLGAVHLSPRQRVVYC